MLIDARLALGDRLGEADPVDDRGVVEPVGEDQVLLAEEGRRCRLIGVPAAHEAEGALGPHQSCARLLELAMDRERPADEPDARGPGPVLLQGLLPRRDHLGVVREAEVVVAGEDDDLATPLHLDDGSLGRSDVVEALVHAVPLEAVEVRADLGLECLGHQISRMTLPALPFLMSSIASAIPSIGKRCVTTGRGSSLPPRSSANICSHVSYIFRPVTP